jgi:hypothetical protein
MTLGRFVGYPILCQEILALLNLFVKSYSLEDLAEKTDLKRLVEFLVDGVLKGKGKKNKDGDSTEEIAIKIEVCVFFKLLWDSLRAYPKNSVIV